MKKDENLIKQALRAYGEELMAQGRLNDKLIQMHLGFDTESFEWNITIYINGRPCKRKADGEDYEEARKEFMELAKEHYLRVEGVSVLEAEDAV